MTWRCGLTRILRSPWARLSGVHALLYSNRRDTTAARRDAAKEALENAQKLQPNTPETCSSPVTINIGCCTITGWPKPHLDASAKCCQVTARSYTRSRQLREVRDIGMKVLPIGSGASPQSTEYSVTDGSGIYIRRASTIPESGKAL
jgi:hypothetical protein